MSDLPIAGITEGDIGDKVMMPLTPPPVLKRLSRRSPARDAEEEKALVSSRRETFLEDRRNRLAQRREQHGQVLARGRVDVSAKLEALRVSLSAAQAARNAIYAKIAATGSKEVAKVQLVVQQNKDKLRAEREARRLALQLKLAEAEKRRETVLRGRRLGGRSMSPGSTTGTQTGAIVKGAAIAEQLTVEQATIRLQRFWRSHQSQLRARRFLKLHLDYDTVGEIPFEVIADVIKTKDVIRKASGVLKALNLLESGNSESQQTLCRVFLSTYMIVGHPQAILMRKGQLEDQLVEHARKFAGHFSQWLKTVALGRLCGSCKVQHAWTQFFSAFNHWKRDDSANLVEVMVAQYCELDLIYQIVKMDSDPIVAAEYHSAIRDNQLMLLTRIRRIEGDKTRSLIRNAVLSARRKRLPRKAKCAAQSSESDSISTQPGETEPVQFFSLGQRQTRLSNRQLIHELALNPSYEITKPTLTGSDAAEEHAMQQNFFRSLQEDLRAGRSASWIPIVVQECKMRLLRLVMPDSSTFKAITAAFDIPFIEAQCRQNSYDYLAFTKTVLDMMQALCSPARDTLVSDIRVLRGVDEVALFAVQIEAIFEVLDILLLDSANFHLSMSSARLIPQAVPYEQKMFQEDLDKGTVSLASTMSWLQAAISTSLQDAASRDPEGINVDNRQISTRTVFEQAFVRMCCRRESDNLPETLHLDQERVSRYRAKASHIIDTASYMMTARNLMRSKQSSLSPLTWTSLRDRLLILVADGNIVEAESIAAEMNRHLDVAFTGTEIDRKERHMTLTNLITSPTSLGPVQRLLSRRLSDLILAAVRGTELGSMKIGKAGLDDLAQEVQALSSEVVKLANLNWECYQPWYVKIVASAMQSIRQ